LFENMSPEEKSKLAMVAADEKTKYYDIQRPGNKQFQDGGRNDTLYVNNPNDPRLTLYQDSLLAHNVGEADLKLYNEKLDYAKNSFIHQTPIETKSTQYTPNKNDRFSVKEHPYKVLSSPGGWEGSPNSHIKWGDDGRTIRTQNFSPIESGEFKMGEVKVPPPQKKSLWDSFFDFSQNPKGYRIGIGGDSYKRYAAPKQPIVHQSTPQTNWIPQPHGGAISGTTQQPGVSYSIDPIQFERPKETTQRVPTKTSAIPNTGNETLQPIQGQATVDPYDPPVTDVQTSMYKMYSGPKRIEKFQNGGPVRMSKKSGRKFDYSF